jgi:transcriptional antiterminator RfaH
VSVPAAKAGEGLGPAWFCVRSKTKHEHLAAAHLEKESDVEVYLPRIRFRRATRRGPVWFTEALFPGYLFARFELATSLRKVSHAPGVSGVVHFGQRWPIVPAGVVEELRATVGAGQAHVIGEDLHPGENVQIAGGAFHGLRAVVTRVMPGRERVAVLLEFLGRQTAVELGREAVVREGDSRGQIL